MRANATMVRTYDAVSRELRWVFGGGVDDVVFTVPAIESNDPTAETALVHGYSQKIGDAGAMQRDPDTGRSATNADKREAMQRVVDNLVAGFWTVARVGGAPKVVNIGALATGMAEVTGKARDKVLAYLESKTEAQRNVLATSEKFGAAYLSALRAGRPTVDTSVLEEEIDEL